MQATIRTSLWIIVAAVLAISACSPVLPTPPASEPPSSTPNLIMTGLVQTLTAAPTFTSTASKTPTITRTPFPSITPIPSFSPIPSLTAVPSPAAIGSGTPTTPEATPAGDYACEITSKSPDNWKVFPPRHDFDGNWKIKNTGSKFWRAGGAVVVTYIDGAKLQKNKSMKSFNLSNDVKPGDSMTVIIDMVAPSIEGAYTSNWGLMINSTKVVFCKLITRITVTK